MYLNNKGSILIFTLIIFSIISTITMMCIGLNYSNKMIYNLEIKEMKLVEDAFSGIEICSSNIRQEVSQMISEIDNKYDFNNYLLNRTFINNIKDISRVYLYNVYIEIPSNPVIDESGHCNFKIISTSIEDKYKKKFQASVKIKNPFLEKEQVKDINLEKLNIDNLDNNESHDNNYIANKINQNIDINDIVIIYDYKEI